jgi:secernin
MCDTFVALRPATRERGVLFAKSADCEVNEANALVRIPRARHLPGETVRLTHLVVPQARETYDVILTKAFWTWGCELGVNELGLCMGEEAVFTTEMNEMKDGIIGPDLMRIGLERARTCREAIDLMTDLLAAYGQGGSAELKGNSHFDSSFLMSDTEEAWILETAGRKWAARRIESTGSISNCLGIRADWDRSSESTLPDRVDFAATFGLPAVPPTLGAPARQRVTSTGLAANAGSVTVRTMFDLMRHHGEGYHPATAPVHANTCMHAGPQKDRWWQADGAMVADVRGDDIIMWATGTSGNCVSIFKPLFPGMDLPDIGPIPTEHFDQRSLWWKHELLHRRAMADFEMLVPEIREDFDALEAGFLAQASSVRAGSAKEKRQFMDACFREAMERTGAWIARVGGRSDLHFRDPAYSAMWATLNAAAGMSGMPA